MTEPLWLIKSRNWLKTRTLKIIQCILLYPWTWASFGTTIVLISLVAVAIFGIKFLVGFALAIVSFFLGACFKLYSQSITESAKVKQSRKVLLERVLKTVERDGNTVTDGISTKEPRNKLDMRLSGSALIDEILHEMIDYILRDYVHSWYDFISEDDEFIHELRKTIQETLVSLSSRVKEVNWIPYLTTHLVDDAASHLRLYRSALVKTKENPNSDLISVFFDLEASMEKNLCRDMVCTNNSHLEDYLQGITESLLYLLLPPDTYGCSPVGTLAQDLLVRYVLTPVLNLFSEPDFVNQYIIWLCQGFPIANEIFMTVIRTSDSIDEMLAVEEFFREQHSDLKKSQNFASSEDMGSIKHQLKTLTYVCKMIEQRLSILKEGGLGDWTDEGEQWQNYFLMPGIKLHSLSLEEILKNGVAIYYFQDYMSSVNGTHYVDMYMNIDAWKTSAESQLSEIEASSRSPQKGKEHADNIQAMLDCMRDAALNLFQEFLSDNATHKVRLSETVVKKFYIQIRTETITAYLFDDIVETLIETMETTEKFYPAFKRNKLYIKCLLDLDLLKDDNASAHGASDDDDEDVVSLDDEDFSSDHSKSLIGDEFQMCRECLKGRRQAQGTIQEELLTWEKNLWEKKYKINAEIIEAGLTSEKGKQFGVYAVQVTRLDNHDRKEKKWHIYRRYSDFYDFHQWIKSKWMRLNKIEFPSKQTFRTTDRVLLEKRMVALNKYLCSILSMTSEQCFGESLQDALLHFLEPGNYVVKKKHFSEKIDTLVNPLKQSVKNVTSAVKGAPDTFISTFDGFTKMFHSKNVGQDHFSESLKVSSSIDEADDNIPLRIVLLLMDEVFDLKSRHQWLRKRIVAFIREILRAMLGDTINRRIVDYVAYLTSPVRVSGYLSTLRNSLWPHGRRMSSENPRDNEVKMRTRVATKASLLASLSDELKHLIGSETTRRGLLCVFDLCQNRVLNKRFLLVLFEGILQTLFPDKLLPTIIQRLHFRSSRVGKNRPFVVPASTFNLKPSATNTSHLSPRGSRKKKS